MSNDQEESSTRLEELGCHWFEQMHPTLEPGGKISVLTYQCRVSRVICPHLVSGKCTSAARPKDRDLCYVVVEKMPTIQGEKPQCPKCKSKLWVHIRANPPPYGCSECDHTFWATAEDYPEATKEPNTQ